jgi:HEAT repeat protein
VNPRFLAGAVPRPLLLLACASLALSAGGCASFWDEVFSRERDLDGYFHPPDPLVVIKESTDGERRARAMVALKEPAQAGGTAQQQEMVLQILVTAAKTDREPLCRLAAIQALGNFRDPRASKTLEEVFQQTKLPFTQDFNARIRQQALRGLEKSGNEDSRHLLVLVARQPGPSVDASSADRQQTQDEKLIAIRALAKYRNPECIETLVYLLETEKDAALRDRAHQSLQTASGYNLPPDPQVWRATLAGQNPDVAQQPTLIQRVTGWMKQ